MTPRAHIIGKQVLDIEIDVGEDFFGLQKDVSQVFHTRVTPALDALFSRYVGADTVVRLGRLEVDLGHIDRARLDDELAARIVEALEPILKAQLGALVPVGRASSIDRLADRGLAGEEGASDAVEQDAVEGDVVEGDVVEEGAGGRRTMEGHTLELWLYFLQNGHFPWWASALEPSAFETRVLQALEAQPSFLAQTQAVVQQTPVALRRLVLQFSDAFLDRLVRFYAPALSPRLLRIVEDFSRWIAAQPTAGISPRPFRQVFWQEALQGVFTGLPRDAEQTVVRRALRRLSRQRSVDYRALLARLQATLDKEEPEAATAQLIRQLVQEFIPPADEAAATPKIDDPALAPEKARRPAHAEPSEAKALAEAAARDFVADGSVEAPREPAESSETKALAADTEEAPRELAGTESPVEPSEAQRLSDHAAPVDQPPVKEEVLPADEEQQQKALRRTPGEEDTAAAAERGEAAREAAAVQRETAVVRDEPPALEDRPVPKPLKEGTEIYLSNAGLVLLHPYLTAHFEHLGLVEEKVFVDEDARQKAIYQLQYLATGDGQALEYSLALNKLLCGHPLEQPLARDIVLGAAEKAEAENLLKAVIRNWPALKNTSPDGLREGFLQRDGKLTRKPSNWLLQVEQKTHDILLGRLSWSLGIVKLPWMPEMLHVEWA